MESKPETLRQITLFATLSDEALRRIARVAVPRAYGPAEMIILAGEPCSAAYFVTAGSR